MTGGHHQQINMFMLTLQMNKIKKKKRSLNWEVKIERQQKSNNAAAR